jgi:hypothetical protein
MSTNSSTGMDSTDRFFDTNGAQHEYENDIVRKHVVPTINSRLQALKIRSLNLRAESAALKNENRSLRADAVNAANAAALIDENLSLRAYVSVLNEENRSLKAKFAVLNDERADAALKEETRTLRDDVMVLQREAVSRRAEEEQIKSKKEEEERKSIETMKTLVRFYPNRFRRKHLQ